MSKSPKTAARGGTAILCVDADLSSAADAILALASKHKLSKPALLNILTAQICGDKHDWGFVKNASSPLVSKRAKPALEDILGALSPAGQSESEALRDLDPFSLSCIEHARDVFISCAEGGDPDLIEDLELFSEEEIDGAISQAAREFIADRFGLPVLPHAEGHIRTLGMGELIGGPIYDEEWTRLIGILRPRVRRAELEEREFLNADEDKKCYQHARKAYEHVAKMSDAIGQALKEGRIDDEDVTIACMRAASGLVSEHFGTPIDARKKAELLSDEGFKTITHLVLGDERMRLHNILLRIDGIQEMPTGQEAAKTQPRQQGPMVMSTGIKQDPASRPSVEPQAPGTLGAPGRNPGNPTNAKKVLGYQVLHREDLHCWGGRRWTEVLSAAVAEADIEAAKAVGVGQDYAIVRVMEDDIQDPTFID